MSLEQDLLVPLLVLALISVIYGLYKSVVTSKRLPYPPGPKPRLILGNNIPAKRPWLQYTDWVDKYGDVVHLTVMGTHSLIINSVEAAVELLEKRSNITSDRPPSVLSVLMGWEFSLVFMAYGDRWRWHRRVYQKEFRRQSVGKYYGIQRAKVNDMLQGLLDKPEDFRTQCKLIGTAVMMKLIYDHDVNPKGDYYADLAENTAAKLTAGFSLELASVALNYFPALKHLPSWFPGASFPTLIQESKTLIHQCFTEPTKLVNKKIEDGTLGTCFISQLTSTGDGDQDWTTGACLNIYFAGADTTTSVLEAFMFQMAKHPEVQQKAQKEIYDIVGEERMPDFDASMPYMESVYREVLRWSPPTPLGLAHATTVEDIFKGYYIPKGTVLLTNMWAMSRDTARYTQPNDFNPSRFFDSSGKLNDDEVEYVFGFGRRICPGRYLASSTAWLAMARILALFNIQRKKDADANAVPLEIEFSDGLVSHPGEYLISIFPRTENVGRRIAEAAKTF